MARVNIRDVDINLYNRVKAEQNDLQAQFATCATITRNCPYCEHKVEVLYRGVHGASRQKCSQCGEEILFSPVAFRTSH